MLISDTIICNKDFSERNVKNLVAEIEQLSSLVYIETIKDEKRINGKSSVGFLSLKLQKDNEFKIVVFNPFEEEMQPDLDKILELISDFNK